MVFQVKRVGNHGSDNPIVARLVVQTSDLLGFCNISQDRREKVVAHFLNNVMPHLITCDTIARRIAVDAKAIVDDLEKNGPKAQGGGRVIEVPQVSNLEQDVEHYLHKSKAVLREAVEIIRIFFGKEFDGPKFDDIIKWCTSQFGVDHEFTRMLMQDQDVWLRKLTDMRNATEHPGRRAGRLYIRNFEYDESKRQFWTPTWQLNDGERLDLALELPCYVNNLLTFCEDLLVVSMRAAGIMPGITFAEIPADQRNPECPIRLYAVLNPPLHAKFDAGTAGQP